MGILYFLLNVCVQYVHVWYWKDVVKVVPKGRVGSTFMCGEKTWCTMGICNEDCGS